VPDVILCVYVKLISVFMKVCGYTKRVSVCVCVCMCVCMYVYIYIYIYACVRARICMYVYVSSYTYHLAKGLADFPKPPCQYSYNTNLHVSIAIIQTATHQQNALPSPLLS
jgi:hypothetical protein